MKNWREQSVRETKTAGRQAGGGSEQSGGCTTSSDIYGDRLRGGKSLRVAYKEATWPTLTSLSSFRITTRVGTHSISPSLAPSR